jgi:transcriptional regulator with XRE-family HTH domain
MKLGQKIAAARRARGRDWNAARLAEELAELGIIKSESWVFSLEAGRVKRPHREDLEALAKILRKPLEYFKDDPEVDNETQSLKGMLRFVMGEIVELRRKVEALETLVRK